MKKLSLLIVALGLLFLPQMFAQDCSCTIAEVENNTVYPCNFIVGTVDTVTTTSGLKNAIIQANATGGNRTILIADGTYQIASTSWYPYITASNIVFRSLSGNRDAVILTGNGMVDVAPDVEIGIFAVGDNITIADLTLRDFGNHGIAVSGDSLFVYNVKIQNTFEQMIKGVSSGDGSDYSRIQCSLFEYPDGVGPQWYIGGLDIHKADNWIVSDNIFKNISSPSVAVAEHAVHFWNFSSNNTVERNLIINCDRGIGFGLGSSPHDGGMIRNNMIYNDGNGLFDDVGIGLETSPNTTVYNNSIYIEYPNAIEYRFAETSNVNISNNLTNKLIKSRNGGQATLTTNNTNGQADWFVNLSAGNLRLMPNNPSVIDQGTTLFEVMVDIDQTPRPQSTGFDIGAHEYLLPVSINNEIIDNAISIFPNPTYGVFTIDLGEDLLESVIIYSRLGMQIKKVFTSEVNISNFEAGVYFVKITTQSGKTALRKVIKS